MKKRIISIAVCLGLLLSASTVSASAMVAMGPAAYVKNGISLDSGSIYGQVFSGGSFTASSSSTNAMSGDVYLGPSGSMKFTVPDQFSGELYNVKDAVFPKTLPECGISSPSTNTANTLTIDARSNLVSTGGSYSTIDVKNNVGFTIDTTKGDVILITDTLKGDGFLSIKGDNKVAIVVNKTAAKMTLRTDTSSVSQDNLYFFIQNGDFQTHQYGDFSGTVVMKTGVFNVYGSAIFDGNVIGEGTGKFTISGSGATYGQYYTPNASVIISGSRQVYGMIESNALSISGTAVLYNSVGSLTLPTQFFGSNPPDPSMTMPSVVVPSDYVSGLNAVYYDTKDMANSSAKKLETQVGNPHFNYQYESPDPTIDKDTFSIQFTGYIHPDTKGSYTFYTYSDDGVRLLVNGNSIIDRLEDISLEFTQGTPIDLDSETYYPFELTYFENYLNSTMILFYECNGEFGMVPDSWFFSDTTMETKYFNEVSALGNGLNISYYNSVNGPTSSDPAAATAIGLIDMAVRDGSPDPAVQKDKFSALFEGYIEAPYTETLFLEFTVDDGIRVYVDGNLLIDEWGNHSNDVFTLKFDAENAIRYKIRVEYYEDEGSATCSMQWYSASFDAEVVPLKYLYDSI